MGIDTRFLSGGGVGSPPYRMIADTDENPGYDLMSYCATLGNGDPDSWISAINWNKMLGSGAPPARRRQAALVRQAPNTLHVRARADAGGVRIGSVGAAAGPPPSGPSPYALVARDVQGAVLASVPMTSSDVRGAAGAVEYSLLDGDVPATGVASVHVTSGSAVLASRAASARPPTGVVRRPRGTERLGAGRSVTVRWRSADPDRDPVTAELDYSANGGRSFRNVGGGGTGNSATLPSELLQPSTKARLRLRLNDGFHDAEVVSPAFVVLPRPPKVTILEPIARQPVAAGSSLYLRGGAVDATGRAIPRRQLRWFAERTLLGRGDKLSAVLPAGTRRVRLVATDRSSRAATTTVAVRMRATTPFFTKRTRRARSPVARACSR